MTASIQDVALKKGKRAVVSTKGGTFRRQKESLWHVTSSCLEHTNCTGVAKPTQRQVAGSTVLRASVVADNSVSAATLAEQLRLQNGVVCGKSLVHRAKEDVLKELYAEGTRSIGLLPSYLRELSAINKNLWTEMR
uniref:Uncharacterized protein n=1 Tax=Globisporangium ultimum (strain ATCC 200006 / CBS 805.95 / DAOM BR144) TaxID=431595 RepID=K3WBE5_GLOUD